MSYKNKNGEIVKIMIVDRFASFVHSFPYILTNFSLFGLLHHSSFSSSTFESISFNLLHKCTKFDLLGQFIYFLNICLVSAVRFYIHSSIINQQIRRDQLCSFINFSIVEGHHIFILHILFTNSSFLFLLFKFDSFFFYNNSLPSRTSSCLAFLILFSLLLSSFQIHLFHIFLESFLYPSIPRSLWLIIVLSIVIPFQPFIFYSSVFFSLQNLRIAKI